MVICDPAMAAADATLGMVSMVSASCPVSSPTPPTSQASCTNSTVNNPAPVVTYPIAIASYPVSQVTCPIPPPMPPPSSCALPPPTCTIPPCPLPPQACAIPPCSMPPPTSTIPPCPMPPQACAIPPCSMPPPTGTMPPCTMPPQTCAIPSCSMPPPNGIIPPCPMPPQTCAIPSCSMPPLPCAILPSVCSQRFPNPTLVQGTTILTAPGPSSSPVLQFAGNLNTSMIPPNAIIPYSTAVPIYNAAGPQYNTAVSQYNTVVAPSSISYNTAVAPSAISYNPQPVQYTSKTNTNQPVITTFVPINNIDPNVPKLVPCDPATCTMNTLLAPTVGLCPIPTPPPSWKQSYGMEQVWQGEFKNLFSRYMPNFWLLLPIIQKPTGTWNTNVDSAKVRFCCEKCGHGWTSMKGRVAFWFVLNPTSGEGVVCLKLYGQQCDRCKKNTYEPAMWYPEEVLKVLVNIYNRVGQAYYGFQQAPYHRTRRPGKPRTPHNSDLCQACKDGVCSERR